MSTGRHFGELFGRGARDWAGLMEPRNRALYDAVHDRIGIAAGTRLLDVGCGPGGAARLARERGARVAGLDASSGSLAVARERVPDGDFRPGDMEQLPWPDRSFDAVTGFNSFPFAGNPAGALREARRALDQGGKLGIVVFAPPEASQQTRIMAAIAALAPPRAPGEPGPFALSAPGALQAVLVSAGFQVAEHGDISVVLAFPSVGEACRTLMSGGGAARAIQHSSEARVRETIEQALGQFRAPAGDYRIENRFQFVIAAA